MRYMYVGKPASRSSGCRCFKRWRPPQDPLCLAAKGRFPVSAFSSRTQESGHALSDLNLNFCRERLRSGGHLLIIPTATKNATNESVSQGTARLGYRRRVWCPSVFHRYPLEIVVNMATTATVFNEKHTGTLAKVANITMKVIQTHFTLPK